MFRLKTIFTPPFTLASPRVPDFLVLCRGCYVEATSREVETTSGREVKQSKAGGAETTDEININTLYDVVVNRLI